MNSILFISIVTQYPIWFLLFCLALGALYAYLLYYFKPNTNEFTKKTRLWLSISRFSVVTLISFLLLSPLLKSITTEVEKPIIIIAQDNSESIRFSKNASLYGTKYDQKIKKMISDLSEKFDVRTYSFGESIKENPSNFNTFTGLETNLSNLFQELQTRYTHRNVGALILATDGIYNKGDNPVYDAKELSFPIYPVAMGDTTICKDVILKKINSNPICIYNNYFPVEVIVNATKCNSSTTILSITKNDSVIVSQSININSNKFSKSIAFSLKATEKGNLQYKIKLSEINGETNKINNTADLFIRVIENKNKVLILANAPHPDIAVLKQALETSQTMEVEVSMIDKFNGSINGFQVVMLHQLPSIKNNCTEILATLNKNNIPAIYFIGNQSSMSAINDLKTGIQLGGYRAQFNEALPQFNETFPLFALTRETKTAINQFPPMISPFGQYQIQLQINSLFKQQIKGIDTDQPLWSFSTIDNQKICLIYGENLWKWRLFNYSQKNNHEAFDEIITKTIQYLIIKEDKSPLRIIHQNSYLKNQTIEISAELYDKSTEMIEDADINFTLIHPGGKRLTNLFTYSNGKYNLSLGILPVGTYKYEVICNYKNEVFKKNGVFNVVSLNLEASQTIANHQLLYQLSKRNNGKVYYSDNIDKLCKQLLNRDDIKPIAHHRKKLNEIINFPTLFLFLILLVGIEWFFRKQLGSY